jgi:protein-S-isoprenylcysteine O-methyltransferase Ste14
MLIFAIFIYAATLSPVWLWQQGDLGTYLGFMLATFGTILAVKSLKGIELFRFLGFRPHDDLKKKDTLTTEGLYRYIRHPLYAGFILIFLGFFLYIPNLASLVHLLALLVYLPVGIYFEEKKLIQLYGEEYSSYRRHVPPIFPKFTLWKK